MTPAQQAYQDWKLSHKLMLRAFTDAELFEIGYNFRDEEVARLKATIEALTQILEEPVAVEETKPAKKPKKNESA